MGGTEGGTEGGTATRRRPLRSGRGEIDPKVRRGSDLPAVATAGPSAPAAVAVVAAAGSGWGLKGSSEAQTAAVWALGTAAHQGAVSSEVLGMEALTDPGQCRVADR